MGTLGAQWAGSQGLWLLAPDSSVDLLRDLGWGRAPFWNSLALFTNEGIGLESFSHASSSNIHHHFRLLGFSGNTVERRKLLTLDWFTSSRDQRIRNYRCLPGYSLAPQGPECPVSHQGCPAPASLAHLFVARFFFLKKRWCINCMTLQFAKVLSIWLIQLVCMCVFNIAENGSQALFSPKWKALSWLIHNLSIRSWMMLHVDNQPWSFS